MKKIAILGCENSHANAFLKLIKENEEFSDITVAGVFSEETEAAEKLKETFNVPVMENFDDAVGKIDGLVITARHGDNHYRYAKPYIDSGIPMFIDKPVTVKEEEAVSFMRELSSKGVRICGGSSLKQDEYVQKLKNDRLNMVGGKTIGGLVRAPYQPKSVYGGFYFYAQHLVEMICEIFGRFPISVTAKLNGGQLHTIFHYEEFDCVGVFCESNYLYYASRMSEKDVVGSTRESSSLWYYNEFKEFNELLHGKEQTVSYKEFISPVFIMNAIERSLNSGKEETIEYKE